MPGTKDKTPSQLAYEASFEPEMEACCQLCKHWKPFVVFSEKGYRCMGDMPFGEQESIKNQVKEREAAYAKEFEYPLGYAPEALRKALRTLEWGHCEMASMGGEYTETTLAIAQDGSDYVADLETSYRFGCIQFKQRS